MAQRTASPTTPKIAPNGLPTAAYSKVYANDVLGHLSNDEGTSPTLNTTFPAYMPKFTGYTFDANCLP